MKIIALSQPLPPFENAALLRDAALYFVPGKYRNELDGVFTRTARALFDFLGPQEARADWLGETANADSIRFYHTDHLGSVRIVTDGAGEVYESIDYQPFGEIAMDTKGGEFDQERHKFTGQMFDISTGLYYYGARHYDPETGRFTQADTIVPNPLNSQDFNRYTYANNNPYKYTDPSGHESKSFISELSRGIGQLFAPIGGIIGSVIGGLALAKYGLIGMVIGAGRLSQP